MKASRKRYVRRHRRQSNAAIRFGWAAKPVHRLQTGRTGSVHEKQLKGHRPAEKPVEKAVRGQGGAA